MWCELLTVIPISLIAALLFYIAKKNKRPKIDLRGKHVAITGASLGIGKELAIQAINEGASVSLLARNRDRLVDLQNELIQKRNSSTQKIEIESLDISADFEKTKKAFERLESSSGPIDILINNAGISRCAAFEDLKIDDFEQTMKTNYMGNVFCTKAVVGSMIKRKFGRIAFVSSQAGQLGIFGYTAYSASKFAIKGLSEALQMELSKHNIYITVSYPPDTDTPGFEEENKCKPEETRKISEGSGLFDSKTVAAKIIKSVKSGSFSCSYGINGFLLTTLNSGTSIITNFPQALLQVVTLPLCRVIAIVMHFQFDYIVKTCKKNN